MDENELSIGIGYQLDRTQIEQIQRTIETTNNASRQLATGFRQLENALNDAADAQNNFNNATGRGNNAQNNFVRQLRTQVQAGLMTVSQEYDRLIARQRELQRALSTTPINTNAHRAMVNQLASVNREIETIERNRFNTVTRLMNQETKAEKERVQELQRIWQEELNYYNNIQRQLNAKSTLKDFTVGAGSGLKNSIFNAGLELAGVRAIANEFQNLGREIVDIDYNLVNTQRIMRDFSDSTADYLLNNATEMAKATNIQITDAQEIQGAWVRINDTYADNKELLSEISLMTSKFMNVGEIENAEEAVTLLNASLLQLKPALQDNAAAAEEFANKWAYMADITAMGTADEYGEAIAKYGANIKTLNGDMDDAIVLASVMADKVQRLVTL